MTDQLQLGVIEKATNTYTLPSKAVKGVEYSCVDCGQRVILRRGPIRKAHFAHFSAETKCHFYEYPNESQIHKDAKFKLAERLKQKFKIQIDNSCPECSLYDGVDHFVKYEDGDEVIIEYRDSNGKYIADVAITKDNKVRYIFEIKYTHATTTSVRPEPWFEFTTQNIFEEEEIISSNDPKHLLASLKKDTYYLTCKRTSVIRYCYECRIPLEDWSHNIPQLGIENGKDKEWIQNLPCVGCKSNRHRPVFIKGFRQICWDCLADVETEKKIKQTYASGTCLIED